MTTDLKQAGVQCEGNAGGRWESRKLTVVWNHTSSSVLETATGAGQLMTRSKPKRCSLQGGEVELDWNMKRTARINNGEMGRCQWPARKKGLMVGLLEWGWFKHAKNDVKLGESHRISVVDMLGQLWVRPVKIKIKKRACRSFPGLIFFSFYSLSSCSTSLASKFFLLRSFLFYRFQLQGCPYLLLSALFGHPVVSIPTYSIDR